MTQLSMAYKHVSHSQELLSLTTEPLCKLNFNASVHSIVNHLISRAYHWVVLCEINTHSPRLKFFWLPVSYSSLISITFVLSTTIYSFTLSLHPAVAAQNYIC